MTVEFRAGGGAFYVDEGRYAVTLYDIEEVESKYEGKRFKWNFSPMVNAAGEMMEDEHGLPMHLHAYSGDATGPKSTARPMFEALLGHSLEGLDKEAIRRLGETVIGRTCTVQIMDQLLDPSDPESVRSSPVKGSWKPVAAARPAGRPAPAGARSGGPASSPEEPPF